MRLLSLLLSFGCLFWITVAKAGIENNYPSPPFDSYKSFSIYGGLLSNNLDDKFSLDNEATTGYFVGMDKTFGKRFYFGVALEYESISGGFGSSGTEPYRLGDIGMAGFIGTRSGASKSVQFFFDAGFKYQLLINSNPNYQGFEMEDYNYGVPLRIGLGSRTFYVTGRAFASISNILKNETFRLNMYSLGLGIRI